MALEEDTGVENELDSPISSEDLDADVDTGEVSTSEADSSPAEDEGDDNGLLSVMRDVLKENEPADEQAEVEGSPPTEPEAGQDADASPSDTDADPDAESYSDVPFNQHPRFKQLVAERRAYKSDAERYQNVQSFLTQHNLSGDEAADMLTIAGLMKTNPREAWERARPTIEKLMIAAGEILPQDLEQRVNAGDMPADQAFELSALRAQTESQRRAAEWAAQRQQQEYQQQVSSTLQQTASMWEGEKSVSDPVFQKKLPFIQREIVFLQSQEGRPSTPQGVRDQLDRAYKAVATQMRQFSPAPQKRAIQPVNGGQGGSSAAPRPKSIKDIIEAQIDARAS